MLLDVLYGADFSLEYLIISILSSLFIIFLILPIHEFAHAWVAHLLGDDTGKWNGRMTLNPLNHIDWLGAASILLVGFGWAKPVPVNARFFNKPKLGMAAVAAAGPVSNLITGFVLMAVARLIGLLPFVYAYYAVLFFVYAAQISVSLAVFNLIPVPPLDGSRVLFAILPDRIYFKVMRYEQIIYYAVMFLALSGAFSVPISSATEWIINLYTAILI